MNGGMPRQGTVATTTQDIWKTENHTSPMTQAIPRRGWPARLARTRML